MRVRILIITLITVLFSFDANAQRGVRIGYIDTEYILENVPEYLEATSQLETKVQKWKGEIEKKLSEIEQRKNDLTNESVLLTPELIKEREEDIQFEEAEILDYQQKRFGPNGDLMIQKKQLIQPIQDQIFAAVQDIASKRKYDFVFDKSADLTMLYSAERFDISEQVLRAITRASKRKQVQNKKEKKAAQDEEVVPEINTELEARQKALEDKKAERAKAAEEKRKKVLEARDAKKKAAEERRKKILEERAKAREDKLNARNKTTESEDENGTPFEEGDKEDENVEDKTAKTPEQILEERKQAKLNDREARKKALEEKKKKVLEAREKARQEKLKQRKAQDSINNNNNK